MRYSDSVVPQSETRRAFGVAETGMVVTTTSCMDVCAANLASASSGTMLRVRLSIGLRNVIP